MSHPLLPWQPASWAQVMQLRGRFPHALLLHGPEGIGKTRFGERLAQALLCEQPLADGQPCDVCLACGWFAQYAHPDYRRVRPENLEEAAGDEAEAEAAKPAKAGKTASKEIRIEQIRALGDFMNVSTHRRGRRVVLLHPAEALNSVASNALLKTLEEPPPDTVFILVSNNIDRLLPTILSRCRKVPMGLPDADQSLAWLKAQGVPDAESWLAEQGGAPLAALTEAESGSREAIDALLAHLANPAADTALKTADLLQKTAPADVTSWLQRWLYDLFSVKFSGKIRYYPKYRREIDALASRADARQLLAVLKQVTDRRAIADHPLSAKLFIEDMLLDYSTVFA
ncbi:DNA polymerase III subunit delta' [Noviherbaspirillum suwonense]|uniref:DNA polymerase III subunit delta' n=1 Tax=Noviherbaspirillum suwonense TaxID=1224511 RepID=A0ABY1PW57_9BURK|nr:DNA polymerase III subunit delta' [Noviherbaspirillum suwonense]SMP48204.1 DNA polymerase-3 subunit delta' [Noviherbaspirillum suwonense]